MAERVTRSNELARDRAKWAWECVGRVKERKIEKRYGTLARKLPSYLQGSGLGQTLAFLLSKAPEKGEVNAERRLYLDLQERLEALAGKDEVKDAMPFLLDASQTEYRYYSGELLLSSQWLKRFAEAKLDAEE